MKSLISMFALALFAAHPARACDDDYGSLSYNLVTPTVSTVAVQSYLAPQLNFAQQVSYADSYVSAAPLLSSVVSDYAIGSRRSAVVIGGRRQVIVGGGRRNIIVSNRLGVFGGRRQAVIVGGRRQAVIFGNRGFGRRNAVIIGGGGRRGAFIGGGNRVRVRIR